jgi:hypothetical protein
LRGREGEEKIEKLKRKLVLLNTENSRKESLVKEKTLNNINHNKWTLKTLTNNKFYLIN